MHELEKASKQIHDLQIQAEEEKKKKPKLKAIDPFASDSPPTTQRGSSAGPCVSMLYCRRYLFARHIAPPWLMFFFRCQTVAVYTPTLQYHQQQQRRERTTRNPPKEPTHLGRLFPTDPRRRTRMRDLT